MSHSTLAIAVRSLRLSRGCVAKDAEQNNAGAAMTIGQILVVAQLAIGLLVAPFTMAAPKGGSSITIEALGTPVGAVGSRAAAINAAGTVIVGDAYWNATAEYPNNWYAARWSRSSASGPWQVEDLRPLLPSSRWSWAMQVNNAGTVTVRSEDPSGGSHYRSLVIVAGVRYDLGLDVVPNSLSESDAMAGVKYDPSGANPDQPLYWASPYVITAELLPVLAPGHGGQAIWFLGGGIRGTADDADGVWLVQWTGGTGSWTIERLRKLPPQFTPSGLNTQGRLAGRQCGTPCSPIRPFDPINYRAVVWDAPYAGLPTYLPNLAGTYSWAGSVMDSGVVVGLTVASNGVDMLPVIWPTPGTVKALPLLLRAKGGGTAGVNRNQITGNVGAAAVLWTLP